MEVESKTVCKGCLQRLPLTTEFFYQIRESRTGVARWEKLCKTCKRVHRKHSQRLVDNGGGSARRQIEAAGSSDCNIAVPFQNTLCEPARTHRIPASQCIRGDGELIYKEYHAQNGALMQLSKAEFDEIVSAFLELDKAANLISPSMN